MKVIQPGFNLNWIEFDFNGNSMGLNYNEFFTFKLYPNPASDFININTLLEDFKVEIFDLLGKKISEYHNLKILDLKELDKGTYIIKISSAYNSQSKLFIKK